MERLHQEAVPTQFLDKRHLVATFITTKASVNLSVTLRRLLLERHPASVYLICTTRGNRMRSLFSHYIFVVLMKSRLMNSYI